MYKRQDLDQPLSAFDPDAIPDRPLEASRAVAPLTRVAEVTMLPPLVEDPMVEEADEPRIVAFALAAAPCSPHEEPRTLAPVARDGDAGLRRWNEMYARMHGTPVTDAPSGAEPVARDSSTGPEEARDVR